MNNSVPLSIYLPEILECTSGTILPKTIYNLRTQSTVKNHCLGLLTGEFQTISLSAEAHGDSHI